MPSALWVLIGIAAFVLIAAWWLYRRWREVDSYFEHEPQGPPIITDITSFIRGSRPF